MAAKKPKVLVLWGDDIGYWNISADMAGGSQGLLSFFLNPIFERGRR